MVHVRAPQTLWGVRTTSPLCVLRLTIFQHSGLAEPYAIEHAKLWLHWPQHPFICQQLPYMVKQRSTSQKYNDTLASSILRIVLNSRMNGLG